MDKRLVMQNLKSGDLVTVKYGLNWVLFFGHFLLFIPYFVCKSPKIRLLGLILLIISGVLLAFIFFPLTVTVTNKMAGYTVMDYDVSWMLEILRGSSILLNKGDYPVSVATILAVFLQAYTWGVFGLSIYLLFRGNKYIAEEYYKQGYKIIEDKEERILKISSDWGLPAEAFISGEKPAEKI